MARIRTEYIVFWILIIAILVIILWKMFGSPTNVSFLIAVTTGIIMTEMVLWKTLFQIENKLSQKISNIDKSTAVGFTNIRNDISDINTKLDKLTGSKK